MVKNSNWKRKIIAGLLCGIVGFVCGVFVSVALLQNHLLDEARQNGDFVLVEKLENGRFASYDRMNDHGQQYLLQPGLVPSNEWAYFVRQDGQDGLKLFCTQQDWEQNATPVAQTLPWQQIYRIPNPERFDYRTNTQALVSQATVQAEAMREPGLGQRIVGRLE